jgi:hypothetical protein
VASCLRWWTRRATSCSSTRYRIACSILELAILLLMCMRCRVFALQIHMIMGAGVSSTNNAANVLKPPLARGLLRCIGAVSCALSGLVGAVSTVHCCFWCRLCCNRR